jgi:hypothetical protein
MRASLMATTHPFQRLNTPARMVKMVWLHSQSGSGGEGGTSSKAVGASVP